MTLVRRRSSAEQLGQGDHAVDGGEGDEHRNERTGQQAEAGSGGQRPDPSDGAGPSVEGGGFLGDRHADVAAEGSAWSSHRCSGRLAPTGEQQTEHRERDDSRRADGELVDGDGDG